MSPYSKGSSSHPMGLLRAASANSKRPVQDQLGWGQGLGSSLYARSQSHTTCWASMPMGPPSPAFLGHNMPPSTPSSPHPLHQPSRAGANFPVPGSKEVGKAFIFKCPKFAESCVRSRGSSHGHRKLLLGICNLLKYPTCSIQIEDSVYHPGYLSMASLECVFMEICVPSKFSY